jgi:hypothetical protein
VTLLTIAELLRRLQLQHKCTREHALKLLVRRGFVPYGLDCQLVAELRGRDPKESTR